MTNRIKISSNNLLARNNKYLFCNTCKRNHKILDVPIEYSIVIRLITIFVVDFRFWNVT